MRTSVGGPVLTLLAPGLMSLANGPAAADDRADPLPEFFGWISADPLNGPEPDAGRPIVFVKGPAVFRYRSRRHVHTTTADTAGARGLAHTSLVGWWQAAEASLTPLGTCPDIGDRYAAVPPVFPIARKKPRSRRGTSGAGGQGLHQRQATAGPGGAVHVAHLERVEAVVLGRHDLPTRRAVSGTPNCRGESPC
ncbi:hypothetical protein ABTZ93_17665 [Streptomyces sp. NPDC097941]|uniref:hypothetical protein n=1 Tax=Streptomyces sp. NPDC097941 TaxID=3155685 RepID=UPI00331A52DD